MTLEWLATTTGEDPSKSSSILFILAGVALYLNCHGSVTIAFREH